MAAELHAGNADQAKAWNGAMGQRWVERQAFMDRMLAPVADILFDSLDLRPGMRVLDIGCGSGDTSFRLARAVGPTGHVTGLDISAPLLARARERTPAGAPVTFIEGDAMIYPLPPAEADLLFSRFGVMFFADPVMAFSNMRKGLKHGARLTFACWRDARANQWVSLPMGALKGLLPPTAPADPEAPGPYSFGSEARVRRILGDAGFAGIEPRPFEIEIDSAGGRGVEAAVQQALEIGPVSRALAEATDDVRSAAVSALRAAYAPFDKDGRIALGGAIWLVTADNP